MQDTIDDTRLHRYFDGDLSGDEAERVRRALDADPALRAKLEGLREVRAVVRASVADGLDAIASDDLWARIEAEIDAPGSAAPGIAPGVSDAASATPERPPLRVIPGGGTVVPGGGTVVPGGGTVVPGGGTVVPGGGTVVPGGGTVVPGGGTVVPGGSTVAGTRVPTPSAEHRGRRIAGVVVGALALAAAILLIVLRPGEPGPADAPIAEAPGPTEPGGAGEPDELGLEAIDLQGIGEEVASTEVLEVDFGENSGAIFSVEGDDGERYAVVWLADVQPKPAAVE